MKVLTSYKMNEQKKRTYPMHKEVLNLSGRHGINNSKTANVSIDLILGFMGHKHIVCFAFSSEIR